MRGFVRACWAVVAEPALRRPVLVLESDDWGADAPSRVADQARALERLMNVLCGIRDETGRAAVMTIGLVSGIIDRDVWRQERRYARLTLAHPTQKPMLEALKNGIAAGVFAIQWHGLEHYWPQALLAACASDDVATWLASDAPTEALPAPLQSRWVDASRGASRPHPLPEILRAIEDERSLLAELFGRVPAVAVPNTFVWDDNVEAAWHDAGVRFVVTCGRRYVGRQADGSLQPEARVLYNGQRTRRGIRYLTRDVYFEPARGHASSQLVSGMAARWREGRPCLVETHRANYVGQAAEKSLKALHAALAGVLERVPDVRFVSSEELGDVIASRDPAWTVRPRPRHLLARLKSRRG